MNHRPDHYPRLQLITLWRSVLFLSALLFAACADDPAAPNGENPAVQSSVRLTSPAAGTVVLASSSLRLAWAVREGAAAPDSVRLEYRANEGDTLWRSVATVPMTPPYRDFLLPASLHGSIALRIQGTKDVGWDVVSPLYIDTLIAHEVTFTTPAIGGIHRVGQTIHIGWSCASTVPAGDRVFIEYRENDGLWKAIGSFPYGQRGTDWQPPSSMGQKYALRIRHEHTPTWMQLDDVFTADIRIRDFPAGTVLARGTALSVRVDVDLPWTTDTAFRLDMTTDDGATWTPALSGGTDVLDYAPTPHCRFRAWRDDLPFADTSGVFSITDNLVDYPVLEVGRQDVYEYVVMVWEVIMGGTRVTPHPQPDVYVLVHGKTVLADRTLYDVTHWSEGSADTVRTTVVESHDGLHRISGDFRPFSIERIFARLDGGSQRVRYGWGDNFHIELDRDRGLVHAVERIRTGPSNGDHTFRRK